MRNETIRDSRLRGLGISCDKLGCDAGEICYGERGRVCGPEGLINGSGPEEEEKPKRM